jgi:energy-coupling factor transporter ATP-binding protein EcfA2
LVRVNWFYTSYLQHDGINSMIRWNIANIFFLGVSGKRREVTFNPGSVNIITGASGTGKSTLIKAIDYCLGSSKCELPAHIRRRSVAVGVKWICNGNEIVIGRIIPPVGQSTSTRMFTVAGRNIPLPNTVEDFDGATTVGAAKAFIERAFGIGDLGGELDIGGNSRGRATIRHVTPYLFVTKEVIYSESVLLHGLEKADKARDIVATMPYFLRATDEASAMLERRLRQLRAALDKEEVRELSQGATHSMLKQRALSLLAEANRMGIIHLPSQDASEADLLAQLEAVSETELETYTYPSEDELGILHDIRRDILAKLTAARRQSRAARTAIREAAEFESAVTRQYEKLMLAEHLNLQDIAEVCPLCESPSDRGRKTAEALQSTLRKVRSESVAVERVKPKLVEHERELDETIAQLNTNLKRIDDQIKSWLRQTEETRRLADLAQARAHLLGRISYFQETSRDESRQPVRDLSVLRDEIAELEARVDRDAKEIKLRRAEAKISQFASEAFSVLPTVAPCIGAELAFSSRQPEITVIETESNAVLRMPDVGSDQNYLAVHVALSFALQRYFETVKSPVPGLLIFDQISRPYFPTRGEDEDETEITGREEDEDVQAMRKHVDFLFAETERRSGLQVLLIEHAYFADDPRYRAATRERWTRASGKALIPLDWPVRADN